MIFKRLEDWLFHIADVVNPHYQSIKPFLSTTRLAFMICSVIFGAIPWYSIAIKTLQNGFNLRLTPPAPIQLLLDGYHAVRDGLIARIVHYFDFFSHLFPDTLAQAIRTAVQAIFQGWTFDVLSIWMIIAVGVYRGSLMNSDSDRRRFESDPEGFREGLRKAAALHKIDPDSLIARVESGLGNNIRSRVTYNKRAIVSACKWHKVAWRNFKQYKFDKDDPHARVLLREWILSLAYSIIGATGYVLASGFYVNAPA